jgi:hypothetical protein
MPASETLRVLSWNTAVGGGDDGAVARATRDGTDGVEPHAVLAVGGAPDDRVGAQTRLAVPLNEAREVAVRRVYRPFQPNERGLLAGAGEKLDGTDPPFIEVNDALSTVTRRSRPRASMRARSPKRW